MTNSTNSKLTHDLSRVGRHGYAVYSNDTMIAWHMGMFQAIKVQGATRVVNVQNAGYFEVEDGEIVKTVAGDDTLIPQS
jgi:hypothetical protein